MLAEATGLPVRVDSHYRALLKAERLLLADEPLDALTRIRMHALLRKLCAAHQPAVLLITHAVDEAIALADRVIVLDGGVVRTDVPVDGSRSDLRTYLLEELGV